MTKRRKLTKRQLVDRRRIREQKKLAGQEKARCIEQIHVLRRETKRQCLHQRTNNDGTFNGTPNIKWMEHSNHIIMGVCGTCFSQFDCSKPEDLALFLADPRGMKNAGRVNATTPFLESPACEPFEVKELSQWQKFVSALKKIFC